MPRDDNRHIFVIDFTYTGNENEDFLRNLWKSIFEKINIYGLKKGRGAFDTAPPILQNRESLKYFLLAEVKTPDSIGFHRRLF